MSSGPTLRSSSPKCSAAVQELVANAREHSEKDSIARSNSSKCGPTGAIQFEARTSLGIPF